jgi:ATP-dependent helicase/nuclease subunit B
MSLRVAVTRRRYPPGVDVRLVEHGPPAREALREAVASAKGRDPLAPVTVAVPSTYAGLALRRALARPSGLVNVRFLALARVSELLGAPTLAEGRRRPLTRPLRAEAVRAVLADAGPPLARVAGHPATERALDASFLELRRAGDRAVAQLERAGDPAAAVARLYPEFRTRTAGFYDDEDLAVAAAGALAGEPPALREIGQVVLFLPTRLSPGETELVRALGAAGRLRALLGLTGDPAADEPAEALAESLAGDAPPSRPAPPVSPAGTEIVSAPDPEDELRAVVRDVMTRAAAGTPLHRIAILFRVEELYARLAHELLDAAGVPWSGPSTRRLADTTAGRVLLGLLGLAETDFARDAVVDWIASGPVRDPGDGHAVPASRWDTLSRRAGIVTGLAQWNDRLTRLSRSLTAGLAATGDEELSEGARRHAEADLQAVEHLARFVADLGARLVPPSPGTWSRLATWARELLDLYLGSEGRRASWPVPEVEAARRVADALDGLAALAEIRAEATMPTFVRALESELDAPAGRVGRFGSGVFVGGVHHAYGGDFDVVHVVGMAEGTFPPLGREDPLIPDRARRLAAPALPVHTVRRAEERRDYLAALAAGPVRALSYPRADPRAQRKRLPARWLVESASRLVGEPVGAEELTRLASADWLHVVPSFEAGVCAPGEPGSLGERDVRSLRTWQGGGRRLDRHPLVESTPSLGAGVTAVRERRSPSLTRFDGHVGGIPGLLPEEDDAVSPTALEEWATCPFRYLLSRVLRVREVERPEATDRIGALEHGSLVHRVLAEFLDSVEPRTSPDEPWDDAERALLMAIGERQCNEAESEGLTGRPLLWKLDRRRILREIAEFLDTDEDIRAALGVVPRPGARELAFGFGGESGEPALVTLADGRTVRFHGVIDRVDQGPNGSPVVVFDYKTGRVDDPTRGLERGNRLQLPVYALAMAGGDETADVRSFYWSTRELGTGALTGLDLDDATRGNLVDKVSTIVDGIGAGVFPAFPDKPRQDGRGRETWENCCYCPYDRVCAPARDDDWTRKRDDPVVMRFRELADPPPEPADDENGAGQ